MALRAIAGSGGGGGGGGSGAVGTVYSIPSGGTYVLTAPGAAATTYAEEVITLRMAGATGGYSQSGHTVDGVLPPIRQAIGSEVSFVRYTTDGGASWHIAGVQPGESIGTWALTDLLALDATTYNGCVALTTGAVAALLLARGGRWRYAAGSQRYGTLLTAPAASSATTYTIPAGGSVAIPGGLRGIGDRIDVTIGMSKAGAAAGTAGYTLYCGAAGTVADAVIRQSATGIAANVAGGIGFRHELLVDAAGTLRATGSNNPINPFGGTSTAPTGTPASVAVTGLTGAGDIYISVGPQVANATDSIQLTSFEVVHHMAG